MLKIRYIVRLISTFVSRFRSLLFAGIAAGVAIFFLLSFVGPSIFGKTLDRIGITGRYTVDNLPTEIQLMLGTGLTKIGESGLVEPGVAQSWDTPDGGKTWIFHLGEGVLWQDGKEIRSEEINYQFSDVTVERSDAKTITFKLQDPFSPFPSVVSKPVFKRGLLSTGEWEVTSVSVVGEHVQTLVLTNSKKERVIYKFYPTEERTKLAFKLGEVDTIKNIYTPDTLEDWQTASVTKNTNPEQVVTIFFNTDEAPFKENKSLRQALGYAIDKGTFGAERALGPISPNSWAYNPQVKQYAYDVERAKDLIGEATEGVEISLVTTPVLLQVAEKVATDWEAVGIKTVVQVSSVIPTQYQAYLAILDIPKDPDQYSIWHSTQEVSNISNFKDARIDKLLEDGRIELNLEERKKLYLDFQRFLLEELPAAFLYHPVTYEVSRK